MKRVCNYRNFLAILLTSTLLTGCANLNLPILPTAATLNPSSINSAANIAVAKRMRDKAIEREAKAKIYQTYPSLLNSSKIKVDSLGSNVLLTGDVINGQAKQNIQRLVLSMPEVQGLFNELKIGRRHTLSYDLHDGYITSQLMGKIFINPILRSSRLKVVTERGTVYLMGYLTQEEKRELIALVDSTPAVQALVFLPLAAQNRMVNPQYRQPRQQQMPRQQMPRQQQPRPQSNLYNQQVPRRQLNNNVVPEQAPQQIKANQQAKSVIDMAGYITIDQSNEYY